MRRILLTALCFIYVLLLTLPLLSQNSAQKEVLSKANVSTDWMSVAAEQQVLKPGAFFQQNAATLGLGVDDRMQLQRTEEDQIGFTHYRYNQFHKGVKIEGAQYLVHQQGDRLMKANGKLIKGISVNTQPKIDKEAAIAAALRLVGARVYIWEDEVLLHSLEDIHDNSDDSYYPDPQLVLFDPAYSRQADRYRLAYKMDIYASTPMSRQWVFVDALNGNILAKQERIHAENVIGTANTRYSGEQIITTDSVAPGEYRLRETARGAGADIVTLNLLRNDQDETDLAVDFVDDDNYWSNFNLRQDEVATDAHWGAEQTYDLMLEHFGRNSIDDQGHELRSYVHLRRNLSNAFWTGEAMMYGDGGGNAGPFISIDIVGHEIAHGLTNYSAGLIYQDESGALNESFSDIFGIAVKFYSGAPNFNWKIGDQIYNDTSGLRSMRSPKLRNHPDTYFGQFWFQGDGDNGGVHINSGVQNFWFYLLTEGGQGVNDRGYAFDVQGIGMDKAMQISYRNLTVYLTESSNYVDAREGAIQAAIDLYGDCSPEVESVTDAWAAVGIGAAFSRRDLQPGAFVQPVFECGRGIENLRFRIDHIACNTKIPAGDTLLLAYQLDGQTPIVEELVLSDTIEALSDLEYSFQQAADLSTIGFYDLRFWVYYPSDNNNLNDTLSLTIENRATQNADWGITAVTAPSTYQCDFSDEEALTVEATYYGCEALPAGTELPISFNINGGTSVSETFTLPAVAPDQKILLTFSDPVDLTNQGFNRFDIQSNNPTDTWESNNLFQWASLNGIDRPEGVTLRFEDELAYTDSSLVVPGVESRIWRDTVSEAEGGRYGIRITGGDPISLENNSLLIDIPESEEEAWLLNTDYISNIEYCVDATDWETIRLSFDTKMTYAGIWGSLLRGRPMFRYAARFRILVNGEQIGETYHPQTGQHLLGSPVHYDVNLSRFAGERFTLVFQTQVLRNASYDLISASSDGDNVVLDNIFLGQDPLLNNNEPNLLLSTFRVFPNPADEKLTTVLDLEQSDRLKLDLINMLGQRVLSIPQTRYAQGQHRIELAVGQLPTGVYWVVVSNGHQQQKERLVIGR